MRTCFHALIAFIALGLWAGPARALEFGSWSPPPEGTEALLLLTGADANFVKPKGCFKGTGGSLYRPSFGAWLKLDESNPPFAWVSTGNVFSRFEEEGMAPDATVIDNLQDTGYSAIGVGFDDLERLGLPWTRHAEQLGTLPWLATNLRVLETGRSALPASRRFKLGDREIAILAVTDQAPARLLGDLDTGTIVTTDPVDALHAEMASWKTRPDYVIVLAPVLQGSVRRLARELEGVDLIVASSALRAHPEADTTERNTVLWIGGWGRFLGRVAFGEGRTPLALDVVEVGTDFPIDPLTGMPQDSGPTS